MKRCRIITLGLNIVSLTASLELFVLSSCVINQIGIVAFALITLLSAVGAGITFINISKLWFECYKAVEAGLNAIEEGNEGTN